MAIDPLLRRSVGFPLRHPLWAVAVAVSVACLALASATPQLVPAAARQNAFEGEVRVADAAKGVGHGLDARAYTTGLGDAAVVAAVTSELDRLDLYGVPIVSVWPTLPYSDVSDPLPVARTSGGAESVAVIVGRDDVVRALGDTGGGGLWLPEQVARDLGVTAGDAIQLSLDYPSTPDAGDATVDAIVAGSYAGAAPGAAVVTLPTDPTDGGSADVFFADTATALKVLDGLGDRSFVKWDLIWDAPVSIEDGRDAAAATRKMASALQDPETTAGRRVAEADAPPVVLSSKVAGFVTRSDEAAAALVPLVSSIARSAQLVALMALMGSLWLSIRSRRRDAALALSTGTGPIRSVVLALVELLVPLSVATAVSIAVLRWAPSVVIGEGAISPGLRADGQRMVLGAVAAAVAALGAVAWFAAWSAEPASRGTAHRLASAVRLDTVAIVAAVVTGAQLATTSGPLLESDRVAAPRARATPIGRQGPSGAPRRPVAPAAFDGPLDVASTGRCVLDGAGSGARRCHGRRGALRVLRVDRLQRSDRCLGQDRCRRGRRRDRGHRLHRRTPPGRRRSAGRSRIGPRRRVVRRQSAPGAGPRLGSPGDRSEHVCRRGHLAGIVRRHADRRTPRRARGRGRRSAGRHHRRQLQRRLR
jgi:hypothetical protein